MITRVWEGKTRIEHSETYTKMIEERAIYDYKKTDGFIKLSFLLFQLLNQNVYELGFLLPPILSIVLLSLHPYVRFIAFHL